MMTSSNAFREYKDISDRKTRLRRSITLFFSAPTNVHQGKIQGSGEASWKMESYRMLFRTFAKSSGVYAMSSLISPLVALVLAPYLTHYLSHNDYGVLVILNTTIVLVTGITQLGLATAFFRAYGHDYESQRDRLDVLSTIVILLLLVSLFISIATLISASWLAKLLFNTISFGDPIKIAALVVLLQNLTVPGLVWLRAENRTVFFTILSIVQLLVSLSATIVLVGVFHLGVSGSLLATGGGYLVIAACTIPVILLSTGVRLRFDIARNLLSFGLPVAASTISYWVLQLSDRYLLGYFGSLAQTASYGVAYILGGALAPVIIAPFLLAWSPVMYSIAKKENATYIFQLVFRWFSSILLFAAFTLSLIATVILDILFPPVYHSASPVIPIVAASTMLYGVYIIFTTGIYIRRKTWCTFIFTSLAALVNVGLNIVLIPLHGSVGAAVSTFVAYAVLALVAYRVNQWIYPIPFETGLFIIALLVGIFFYVGSVWLTQAQNVYGTCAIDLGALCLYGGCLMLLGKLAPQGANNIY